MQTFLPYSDPLQSARCLDFRRLGKQRVEALQILNVLHGKTTGWANHPAVKMWQGYEGYLAVYMNAMCFEWTVRGYKDTVSGRYGYPELMDVVTPHWLGDKAFHLSHKSNLMRKFPTHYSKWFGALRDDLPYIWPIGATS